MHARRSPAPRRGTRAAPAVRSLASSTVAQILDVYGAACQALYLAEDDDAYRTLVSTKVSDWLDQSGNGRHATQTTDANRPTWDATAVNSLPGLTFAGSQLLDTAALDLSSFDSFAIHVVGVDTDTAALNYFWASFGSLPTAGTFRIATNISVANNLECRLQGNVGQSIARSAASFSASSPIVLTGTGDLTLGASESEIRRNGTNVTNTRPLDSDNTIEQIANEELNIGAGPGVTQGMSGSLAAVVLAAWSGGLGSGVDDVDTILADYRSIS